jgi:hypothetical protein
MKRRINKSELIEFIHIFMVRITPEQVCLIGQFCCIYGRFTFKLTRDKMLKWQIELLII